MLKSTLNDVRRNPQDSTKLAACLRWLNDNVARFSPWRNKQITGDGIKAFAELAIVHAQLDRQSDDPDTGQGGIARAWRDTIVRHCGNPAYAEQARKRPACAFSLLLPYLILRGKGYRWAYHEETLSRLARWGYPAVTEAVPYRLLDRAYFLSKAGCLPQEPDWLALYRGTALANITSLVYLEKEIAYSATHTIFYLTDFGNRPAPLPHAEICRIAGIVESLLLHYWRLGNWDLTGELLVSLRYLRQSDSAIHDDARDAFCRAIHPGGYIPADRREEDSLRSAPACERGSARFGACYHTTLVSVLYFLSANGEEAQ